MFYSHCFLGCSLLTALFLHWPLNWIGEGIGVDEYLLYCVVGYDLDFVVGVDYENMAVDFVGTENAVVGYKKEIVEKVEADRDSLEDIVKAGIPYSGILWVNPLEKAD